MYNMKQRRSFMAISQMELAERADISSSYVGEMELGHKYPSAEMLERLAEALGVEPFRLLMSPEDVADAAGAEAIYAAADIIREYLALGLEDAVRSMRPQPDKDGRADESAAVSGRARSKASSRSAGSMTSAAERSPPAFEETDRHSPLLKPRNPK
jgi:transcriptional regulator with XRE-family HTH domain